MKLLCPIFMFIGLSIITVKIPVAMGRDAGSSGGARGIDNDLSETAIAALSQVFYPQQLQGVANVFQNLYRTLPDFADRLKCGFEKNWYLQSAALPINPHCPGGSTLVVSKKQKVVGCQDQISVRIDLKWYGARPRYGTLELKQTQTVIHELLRCVQIREKRGFEEGIESLSQTLVHAPFPSEGELQRLVEMSGFGRYPLYSVVEKSRQLLLKYAEQILDIIESIQPLAQDLPDLWSRQTNAYQNYIAKLEGLSRLGESGYHAIKQTSSPEEFLTYRRFQDQIQETTSRVWALQNQYRVPVEQREIKDQLDYGCDMIQLVLFKLNKYNGKDSSWNQDIQKSRELIQTVIDSGLRAIQASPLNF